ncbi:sensor histidine kinase [Nonomuraea gerenzanensis]|uniref:Oxygen sensor histidine kinase NreB n=1 Tax=Nonomuraea gerenzanensis TaxID=93944 RepID=A0A1M4EB44_9ACTN|nr:sensor histidine kinase [Nonomuraea gerenzanensis]UBU18205.1 sensor histidine kinase [Nonomuraea gerenzanensis]SBO96020.1 two-component system sensor kinase [Nonomuraea gerenzanensis]
MRDAATRWPLVLAAGPYALLALLTAVTVALHRSEGSSPLADLVLCALIAAWMLGLFTLRPAWRGRAPVMAVFVAGLILLTGVLVVTAPWFGLFTPVVYVFTFRLLRWPWQPVGVGAVAVVAGTAQAYDVDKSTGVGLITYAAVVAANVVPMCAFAWFARRAALQEEERERALHEAREANRRLAASLAENAALHERLLAQARDAAVQEERQRMAREIHDTLAQGLTGIIAQLRAAEGAGDDPAIRRRHVAAATKLARESLSEARRSVHALRPEPLRSARLSEALAGVAERWSALHEIPVQVTTTGTARPIRPEAEVALLRIAQEALANVAKHARARRVGVTLSYLEHEAALDVRDDGDGFDPSRLATIEGFEAARLDDSGPPASDPGPLTPGPDPRPAPGGSLPDRGGFGLITMRQRVESLSGTLQIESEPGGGTGISARVPLERAEVCG